MSYSCSDFDDFMAATFEEDYTVNSDFDESDTPPSQKLFKDVSISSLHSLLLITPTDCISSHLADMGTRSFYRGDNLHVGWVHVYEVVD